MTELREHRAMGRTYEIIIGGIAYPGQCRTVESKDGKYFAVCKYFNTGNPDATFRVEVDGLGNEVE